MEECLTCSQDFICDKCKSKNSRPRDDYGCKCDQGYFNLTQLIRDSSCIKCSQNECLDCPQGFDLMGKCLPCPSLCSKCDTKLECIECTKNSYSYDRSCICYKGFSKSKNKCVEVFFYSNLTINFQNRIFLAFSEPVIFTNNDFRVYIERKLYQKNMTKVNYSKYIITPDYQDKIFGDIQIEILITKSNLYSKFNSSLYNYNLTGFLNFSSSKSSQSTSNPTFQIMTFIAIALASLSNPSSLWAMLNTIQLIYYMPLNSVPYTDLLRETTDSLIDYSIVPNIFSIVSCPAATSPPSKNVKRFGIKSSVLLLNSGPIWLSFISSLISITFIFILTKILDSSIKLKKLYSKLKFNLLIRFWIEAYLDLGLLAFIQTTSEITENYEGHVYYCIGLAICFLIVTSPFFFYVTMTNSFQRINDSDFALVYSSLYEEFKNNRGVVSTLYYPVFMFRRLSYVLIQIFLNDFPIVQAYLNIAFTLAVLGFLFYYKQFKEREIMISNLVSELCVFIVFTVSSLLLFTKDGEHVFVIERVCIISLITAIGLQFAMAILSFIKSMKILWKKVEESRSMRFVKKAQDIISNNRSAEQIID